MTIAVSRRGLEVLAGAGGQQPPQAIVRDDRDGPLGHDGRAHSRHGAGGDLLFFLRPAVQHAQAPVAGGNGLRCSALEQLAQEGLQVLAAGV
jgi:hypothetical protein